jgi:phosphonopyruvate decarboxylase
MAMKPEDVLRAIAEQRGEAVVVPTMTTSPAWRQIAPDDLSVTCVGFMGGASSLGLGIALAQPERRVIVLDGDGSLLMQLGTLATVAGASPRNFTHMLFKNGVYHTSGSQAIPGGAGVDFAGMAQAAGYRTTYTFDDLEDFRIRLPAVLAEPGPVFVQLNTTEADQTPMTAPGGAPFHQQVEVLRDKLIGAAPDR